MTRVTPEHPVFTGNGTLALASVLAPGDILPENNRILSIRKGQGSLQVYNLLTEWPHTYFAEGLLVHNKGCFLPQTPVRMADGSEVMISNLRPGDSVTAFNPSGGMTTARINKILTAQAPGYFEIETEEGTHVEATAEHPFYLGNGRFKLVESLHVGDQVETFHEAMKLEKIKSVLFVPGPQVVYNLQTDFPNTFIASGFAVHNKGGGSFGGGGGAHYYYYRGAPLQQLQRHSR